MENLFCRIISVIISWSVCTVLWADQPQVRHGILLERQGDILVQGGVTATIQSSSDGRILSEGLMSFDLAAELPVGNGYLTTYVEGNLTPRPNGLSTRVNEVNADAGSALDGDGKGRLQVSEIHYTQKFGLNSLTVGLLDPDCRIDSSQVANDETRQFLAHAFVNNPTISFPDYSLGACMHIEHNQSRPGMNLLLTSSHGLADNPHASYSELFDVGASGKGVFIGTELYWQSTRNIWRLGLWRSTAKTPPLNGSGPVQENYGVYLSSDHNLENYKLNLRIGSANDEVSEAADFISLALEKAWERSTLGVAVARTGVSSRLESDRDDIYQSEIYLRLSLGDGLQVTPSLQWVKNSGFDASGTDVDDNLYIYSLRLSYLFQ